MAGGVPLRCCGCRLCLVVGSLTGVSVGVLTRLGGRDLADEVLVETGRRERWSRLLLARVVVYYVMALCLLFQDGSEEVMRKLVNGLRFLGTWRDGYQVPPRARSRRRGAGWVRRRCGCCSSGSLSRSSSRACVVWHGWRMMAVDGVVPDTPVNREALANARTRRSRGRIVGLGERGTHAIVAAGFDS